MEGHHLILGKLKDFLTGQILNDTHDERYRQNIANLLVTKKGYLKQDINSGYELTVRAGKNKGILKVDFLISLAEKTAMIIKYGPGSLTTRHRPGLALSRLTELYQIPVLVVTNGEDADILDGASGRITGSGLEKIPSKTELLKIVSNAEFKSISKHRREMESRIAFCYEIDGACPCDTTVCKIN
ncbi:Type I restriction enzyme R N-terminal domain-containing protein [Desulfonema limicola]|uniref:Type I restriction enzyme R N-terminal domain-containing protein n=1 Tax=Desulfonema limicola TaxID=45656 RepID=A0A975B5Z2_9BACT|nr:type I restriction enzyme HsdR N-terminal domain-containing protein [Desulfonema limicola]QTA79414.1 Type I restriction enzyme R N-terminal domain-containing protein [Desulfonema limicola]